MVTPQAPDRVWQRLEIELDKADRPQPRSRRAYSLRVPRKALALAASLLVVLGLGWFGYATWFSHNADRHATVAFGQYVDLFQRDPNAAQRMLVAEYNGRSVNPARATRLVGYRPATSKAPPEGYTIVATHVLEMPCCRCVQTVCERGDGSIVAIFEHREQALPWFEDRRGVTANCSGKRCRLFDIRDAKAATWTTEERQITAIGVRGLAEVNQLVRWLEDHPKGNPS
jgi:hypothetical protein